MSEDKKKAEETAKPTLESTNSRIDEMVVVLNNLISYCNTIEKWRTMQFKKANEPKNDTEVISDAGDKK